MNPPTEAQIKDLVTQFYGRAREHPELGKVFNPVVADWDHHIGVVQGFWSKVLLGTPSYNGQPFQIHMNLGIRREHFEQWLGLFRESAHATLPPEAALQAIAKAEHMAESFKAGLFPLDPI